MVLTIDAVYDGQVFRPVHPLTLPVNMHVQIAVTTGDMPARSFLDVAESLALNGPPDRRHSAGQGRRQLVQRTALCRGRMGLR